MSRPAIPFPVYLIAIGAFALGMSAYVTAGLIPMIETAFSVSTTMAVQLVTTFSLAYGIGSPIGVALLPAHRQRFGLLSALALFVLINAASTFVGDFFLLLLCRTVAGICAGIYFALGIAASASLVDAQMRGRAIAIIMSGMASGAVLGVPVSLLLAERLGWQGALWLVAILGLIPLIGLLLHLPPLPCAKVSSLRSKLTILVDKQVLLILIVSLCTATASLGMYTFLAPFMANPKFGGVYSIAPYLFVWGMGGVSGSFSIGLLIHRIRGAYLTLAILLILALSLFSLPFFASIHPWFALLPIFTWGAVGWALPVPQNNELLNARAQQGDGNLAAALNASAIYSGSALGAAAGGILLFFHLPVWSLPLSAGAVAIVGAVIQVFNLRQSSVNK